MKKYVIKNLSPSLDSLVAECDEHVHKIDGKDYLKVKTLSNKFLLFKQFSVPLDENGILLCKDNLKEYVEPEKDDMLETNPFGKFISNEKFNVETYTIYCTRYNEALTIKVVNLENTLYSHSFLGKDYANDVHKFLTTVKNNPDYDWDNFCYDLKKLQGN